MFENEKVVESKICKHCKSSFDITDKDLEFYEKVSPSFGGKKILIPTPTLCPDCRQQRRILWRNERKLYKRKCDATGKIIISMYSPDKIFNVYKYDVWWSDIWNSIDYGLEMDFNNSFFHNFKSLLNSIPHPSTEVNMIENSDYSNCVGMLKDCYLLFASGTDEKCLYGDNLERSENCIDCTFIYSCQKCYQLCTSYDCYKVFYSFNCNKCLESSFLYNCVNCSFCFSCSGLKDSKYCILNKGYKKEDYFSILNNKSKKEEILKKYQDFKLRFPVKYYNGYNLINSTGDYLYNCEDLFYSYITENSKNCKYTTFCRKTQDCLDFDFFGDLGNRCYESLTCGYSSTNCLFSISCINSVSNLYYCYSCYYCSNCFGCIGLKNKSYCILNKQYTKEEYNELVPKIIEHMKSSGERGEFFPSSLSPFGYNETVAQEYFPLTREEVINDTVISSDGNEPGDIKKEISPLQSKGQTFLHGKIFNRSDYESPIPKVDKIIPANKLPENISDIPDDILNWAIECEITKKPFRIIKEELEFYRKHNLPIPRRHPDQRHLDRMKLRNPRKLYDRVCDKCKKEIKTTYSPERSEIVYCETCYNKEIY